jgi:hypothetical protein
LESYCIYLFKINKLKWTWKSEVDLFVLMSSYELLTVKNDVW